MSQHDLLQRIRERRAQVVVIGLGYVGLPMAAELARAGFQVLGLDVAESRVATLNEGRSYIQDVSTRLVRELVQAGRLRATADYACLAEADVIIVCVPTPFTENKAPDHSYIVAASRGIRDHLKPGQLIILQSTTHPGTTEEEMLPILAERGLEVGRDFFLAFSPERIDPGNRVYTVRNTPKVVGGVTPACAELARELLSHLSEQIVIVSNPRAAEMTKLLENIFRSVNIALVNELALLCERMGIDVWEVIEAASSKPFGYMPFYPGPGVGGACIPVDPYYLAWKAREFDFSTKFIELAAEVNQSMPFHVVDRITRALASADKPLAGSRVLLIGVAFKRDVDDARYSPAQRIVELLAERGAQVSYHDPLVPLFNVGERAFSRRSRTLQSVELSEEALQAQDCVVIITPHSQIDYAWLVEKAPLVVDTTNATRGQHNGRVVRLGTAFRARTPIEG